MSLCAVVLAAAVDISGAFPLLCTPYAQDGSLDAATLAKEARFVADCGTKLPVIIQTYNEISPMPSADCLIDLARRHPGTYGWFKMRLENNV